MKFRTYREVTGSDRSQLLRQVTRQRDRVAARLGKVDRVVAIMSGKGGVGKSYVTAGLATGLTIGTAEDLGGGVGVLDADLNGPTTGAMLGASGPLRVTENSVEPAVGANGIKVFSTDLLVDEGQPLRWREPGSEKFVWRETLEIAAVREFLSDVAWGELSLLLIDMPPGVGRISDLAELVPDLDGVVAVTIPSEESRRSVERSLHRVRESGVEIIGLVENMSGYRCGSCGVTGNLYGGDAGADLADQFSVPLLGRIPFEPSSPAPADGHPTGRVVAVPKLPNPVIEHFLEEIR
ncbi:MAG: P-loop NTPase [Gemmatimonadales bacterium]